MPAERKKLVAIILFTAVIAVSFASIFFRKAAPTHPLIASGTRLAMASLMLLPFLIKGMRDGSVSRRLVRHAGIAGLFYALHFGFWVSSLMLTTVAASVTLVTTTPLILAVVGLITGKDRPTPRLWLALALGVIGLILIGKNDFSAASSALVGDLFAFLGALSIAGYLLTVRNLGDAFNLLAFSSITCAVGALLLFLAAIVLGVEIHLASLSAFGFLFLAALIPQLVGHNLLTWSLRRTKPAIVAMSVVGEPVVAAFLSWLILGEQLPLLVAVGGLIALLGVITAVSEKPPFVQV